jgi:hypothetical protein
MEIGGLAFEVTRGVTRQQFEHVVATVPADAGGGGRVVVDDDDDDDDGGGGGGGGAGAGGGGVPRPSPSPSPSHYVVLGPVASTVLVTPDLDALCAEVDAAAADAAARLSRDLDATVPPVHDRGAGGSRRARTASVGSMTDGDGSDGRSWAAGGGGGGGGGGAMKPDPGAGGAGGAGGGGGHRSRRG